MRYNGHMKNLILLLIACIFTSPVFATTPSIANFAYGPAPEERMDIYAPANASRAPVIFMVHGGGWKRGDKDARGVVDNKVERWVKAGFVFISVNYPMLPETDVAGQAVEIARALATAQKNAATWGGDPDEFILMGHSAGAHLVSMLTANPDIAYREGAAKWRGAISLDSGALNVGTIMKVRHFKLYDDAFGTDPTYWDSVSPSLIMTDQTLPWLGVCASGRKISCVQNEEYKRAAEKKGVMAATLPIDKTHGEINADLGSDPSYTKEVEKFMAAISPAAKNLIAQAGAPQIPAPEAEKTEDKRGKIRALIRERIEARRMNE